MQGKTLSQGQLQLLSLARAMLLDRPILVLDEANASVDAAVETIMDQAVATFVASGFKTVGLRFPADGSFSLGSPEGDEPPTGANSYDPNFWSLNNSCWCVKRHPSEVEAITASQPDHLSDSQTNEVAVALDDVAVTKPQGSRGSVGWGRKADCRSFDTGQVPEAAVRRRTLLVVAHRLTGVMGMDQVWKGVWIRCGKLYGIRTNWDWIDLIMILRQIHTASHTCMHTTN